MKINFLSWDSEFFKKKIGLIQFNSAYKSNLENLLTLAKLEGYELIYLFAEKEAFIDANILNEFNGKLVDRKITFEKSVTLNNNNFSNVEIYNSTILCKELEELAFLSGKKSRFLIDGNFAPTDFYRMYKTWITNSLNKKIADHIFVTKTNGIITGMATLKTKSGIGEIGLIAISEIGQGKGFGKQLIYAIENKLIKLNIDTLEVPTQMDNKQACSFYEKCGFSVKSIVNIYHFWL